MANTRRRLTGRVTHANKSPKTIMVAISTSKRHPLYGKVIRNTKQYIVHDEHEEAKTGDIVRIVESRPISRRKRWTLETILRAQAQPVDTAEELDEVAEVPEAEEVL